MSGSTCFAAPRFFAVVTGRLIRCGTVVPKSTAISFTKLAVLTFVQPLRFGHCVHTSFGALNDSHVVPRSVSFCRCSPICTLLGQNT